jgi:hypothetical protein
MFGAIGAIVAFFSLSSAAWSRQLDSEFGGPWALVGVAVGFVVLAFLVGMLFVTTTGMIAMGWMAGSVVAAVICLFTGQFGYVLPMLLNAVAGWFVQQGQAARAGLPHAGSRY